MENIISLYEKLGLFYFGKEVNPKTLETTDNLLLYKSKDYTTHAVIIRMTGNGKTGLGIGIIEEATIDTAQRMFFVTLFLNKYISWMRQQRGTPSLRTILYMDEIFGFFPATSNPPSKKPMLILLKQARAYGVGVVLATQNPVDLDYKGLSNIGSWFLGKLQTKQDKDRVMDGLIKNSVDSLSKSEIGSLLSNMKKRRNFRKNIIGSWKSWKKRKLIQKLPPQKAFYRLALLCLGHFWEEQG